MNSKKILIFSTAYYPFVGGAEVAIKEITDRISDVGFDLITAKFGRNLPKFEKIGNINVYRLGIGVPILDKLLLPFWGAVKAIFLNNKNNYSAYWCVMATFGSGAAYVANIISNKKVPIILTLQEGDSEEHFKNHWFGLINLSWWLALKNTEALTVISSYLAGRARRFGYKGKIEIIPNGVDVKNFQFSIFNFQERQKTRKELGIEEKDITLITTSRLVVKNGVEDVIKALPKLSKNVKFVVFGEGKLKEKLQKLAKKLEVSSRVIFKNYVSHFDIPKYLKSCDIFIRPSLSEGMGNSFIEAMAAGIPVIGTPVGGIVDFLKDKETGLFCNVNDPKSIADKVMEYINNPDSTSKIIENARKLVAEKYDWNLISKQMKEVFDNTKQ